MDIVAARYSQYTPEDLVRTVPWKKVCAMAEMAYEGIYRQAEIESAALLGMAFGKK